MWDLLKQYLINFVLNLLQIYSYAWNMLFTMTGPIKIIHFYNGNNFQDITFNYYLNYRMKYYQQGTFFCKIYDVNRIEHFAFNGDIIMLKQITLPQVKPYLRRKNVTLIDDNRINSFDLNLMDNYLNNVLFLKTRQNEIFRDYFTDLKFIFDCFQIKCSHLQLMTLKPYSVTKISIENASINDVYCMKN